MVDMRQYKGPIITIIVIIGVLMLMIAVGYTIGLLSEDPDGLEAAIIGARGEEWLEGLPSVWNPILGWIENEYVAGILGIIISVVLIMGFFYLINKVKNLK